MALAVDGQDNTIVAVGIADASGGQQVVVAQHDAAGAPVGSPWVLATSHAGQTLSVADLYVDRAGSLFVVGNFSGTVSLSGQLLTSVGDWDVFVAKYNVTGSLEWTERFGGPPVILPPPWMWRREWTVRRTTSMS